VNFLLRSYVLWLNSKLYLKVSEYDWKYGWIDCWLDEKLAWLPTLLTIFNPPGMPIPQ